MPRLINPLGGIISFINDDPSGAPPYLPVSEHLAKIVESAVLKTGLSININSTTGGKHSAGSSHYSGLAVDINRVGGQRVDNPANAVSVSVLQIELSQYPEVAQLFGPFINIRKQSGKIIPMPHLRTTHLNHIHVSSVR